MVKNVLFDAKRHEMAHLKSDGLRKIMGGTDAEKTTEGVE